MSLYVSIINGMGDSATGTGADESDLMQIASDFLGGAGVHSITDLDFEATENSPADKSIDLAVGTCYVQNYAYAKNTGKTKFYRVESDAIINKAIADNASGNPRIDLVYLKVDQVTTPNDEASNVATIEVVTGTPAASPVAPSIPASTSGYALAQVAVANGFSSITNANITDVRGRTGFSVDSVSNDTFADVYIGSTQAIPTGATATKVQFNTETSDAGGNFSTSLNRYLVPSDGMYEVSASVRAAFPASGTNMLLHIVKNSTEMTNEYSSPANANAQTVSTSKRMRLVAGDAITITFEHDKGSDIDLTGGVGFSYFEVTKITR